MKNVTWTNSSNHMKPEESLKFQIPLCEDGQMKEKLHSSKKENLDTEDITLLTSLKKDKEKEESKSVTVESLVEIRKEISSVKSNSCEKSSQTTKSLKTSDQVLTLRGKVLKPFWTRQSKKISKKLWLPIKTDCADLDLTSYNIYSKKPRTLKSWFSMKKSKLQEKNLSKISCQSPPSSLHDSMVCGEEKPKIPLKTIKIRLILNDKEKQYLDGLFGVFRWYYNIALDVYKLEKNKNNIYSSGKVSGPKLRDIIKNYKLDIKNRKKTYKFDKNHKKNPVPEWYDDTIHNRIPRGAYHNFTSNIKSAISNYQNGHIKHFDLSYRTKKDKNYFLSFEDKSFPKILKQLKGIYKYGRKRITYEEILKNTDVRGIKIHFDRTLNRYTLLYPVETTWKPITNENQIGKRNPFISLDTGVRTFQTGYSNNHIVEIGKECWRKLYSYLLEIDKCNSILDKYGHKRKWKRRKALFYHKIQNLKNELHWKSCSYLVKNYENILLPEFAIMSMVKGKLPKKIKRLLYLFSYYKFKEKLIFKGKEYGANILIVDESYTSKTCTNCGNLHKTLGSNKIYKCEKCDIVIDRDINGARNILLKNHKLIKLKVI